jgi:hypothetical protein
VVDVVDVADVAVADTLATKGFIWIKFLKRTDKKWV